MSKEGIEKVIHHHNTVGNILLALGGILISILVLFGSLKLTGSAIADIPQPFVQLVFVLILAKAAFFIVAGIYRKKIVRTFKHQLRLFGY